MNVLVRSTGEECQGRRTHATQIGGSQSRAADGQSMDSWISGFVVCFSAQKHKGRLKGAVDRELGGNIVRFFGKTKNVFRILTLMRKNYFYSAFFEDPSCAKCSK